MRMNRASTDMGNVSQVLPSIHPYIGIGSLPAVNHQKEFAAAAVSSAADRAVLDASKAMAHTCIDLALDVRLRARLVARLATEVQDSAHGIAQEMETTDAL